MGKCSGSSRTRHLPSLESLPLAFALAAAALAPGVAAPAAAPLCDASSALTLIGMDTSSGQMLFALPPPGAQGPSWVVELDGGGRQAHAYPEAAGIRFSPWRPAAGSACSRCGGTKGAGSAWASP